MNLAQAGNEFDLEFRAKSSSRYETFKVALNLLDVVDRPVNILETGCVRQENDYGAGYSTYIFAYYLQNYAATDSTLTSVDINHENLNTCMSIIQPHFPSDWSRFHFNTIEDDSINYLKSLIPGNCRFEFIYLDSLDANLEHRALCEAAQVHQVEEAKLAVQLFSNKAPYKILLLDDNNLPFGGKTKLTKIFLKETGWICVLDYQQSLWIKINDKTLPLL